MATPPLGEDTAKAVLHQVVFYFGDSNIPRDDFLKKKKSARAKMAMRCHLNLKAVKANNVPELTLKAVAETLRTSSSLKKHYAIKADELIEKLDSRTIAASPFEFNVQREDVEAFFGKYAMVNSVRLPCHVAHKKYFCGTALIEFCAEEDAQKMLEQSLVFAAAELELKPKKDFGATREEAVHSITGSMVIMTQI